MMRVRQTLGMVVAATALGACSEASDESVAPYESSAPAEAPRATGQVVASQAVQGEPPGLPPLPVREVRESDFVESDQSRDPFRSFVELFTPKTRRDDQRPVAIDRYSVGELRLVGIVTRGVTRALLADPSGTGHVVHLGQFVGKDELVVAKRGSGAEVAVNWRIDRIRDGDVVLVREDPAHPEIPAKTMVLSLRTPDGQLSLEPS